MSLLFSELIHTQQALKLLSAIRYPIGSPIIVMIWNVVFANKSRKLGWIWMKLGRWGWGLKRLSLARFQRNHTMGFGESAKMGRRGVVFCDVNYTPLLPLSFDRFPTNSPRTRVQVVARDTWFHISERFPLRGWNSNFPKNPLSGYPVCAQPTGHGKCSATPTLFPSPIGHPTDFFPRWLLLRDVPFSTYPPAKVTISAMDGDTVAPPGERRDTAQ